MAAVIIFRGAIGGDYLTNPCSLVEWTGFWSSLRKNKRHSSSVLPWKREKGYATLHHPRTIHGSYENASERPRRAFVLNVFADGTVSDTDSELLEGVPIIPKGHRMGGQFFPLLFNPSN